MEEKTEQRINSFLDTIKLLDPISVRIVINKNHGLFDREDLGLWFIGKNNDAFQEMDSKFYRIMRTQNDIQIPSIEQSRLLVNLDIGDASAIFHPIHSDHGYYGCIWACFEKSSLTEEKTKLFGNFHQWLEDLLNRALQDEISIQMLAKRYAKLMERLNSPAIIIIFPERTIISNPRFESLAEKEKILHYIREEKVIESDSENICSLFNCSAQSLDFPGGKKGTLYIFGKKDDKNELCLINEDEISYYKMEMQRLRGCVSLLESSGNFGELQINYVEKIYALIDRIDELFGLSIKQYFSFQTADDMKLEVISVPDIVKSVISDLAAEARKKKIEIVFNSVSSESGSSKTGKTVGSPWLFTLMVYNLLRMAIEGSFAGKDPIKVELENHDAYWQLSVIDQGKGISPLDIETINTPFNFGKFPEIRKISGIDLIKYVIFLHKGTLSVQSVQGKGSSFIIKFPYY